MTAREWNLVAKHASEAAKYPYIDDAKRERLRGASAAIGKATEGCQPRNKVTLNPSIETIFELMHMCANRCLPVGDAFRKVAQKCEVRPPEKPKPPLPSLDDVLAAEREGNRTPVESEQGDLVRGSADAT